MQTALTSAMHSLGNDFVFVGILEAWELSLATLAVRTLYIRCVSPLSPLDIISNAKTHMKSSSYRRYHFTTKSYRVF